MEPHDGSTSPGRVYQLIRPRMGTRNVLVPAGSRRGALAGISLITRSKAAALAAQWGLYYATAVLGTRFVPGERVNWEPPGGGARWDALTTCLGPFDDLALYERPQASRTGLAALLLREGRPVGFLKLREEPAELDREHRAMVALTDARPETFRVPRVLDRGSTDGWHWMLIEAMPPRPAAPARRIVLPRVLADIQRCLEPLLPRARDVPVHWRPMHGDLTPWNLRRCGRGLPWLIDWEDAAWAPPGADQVYYAVTSAAVLGRSSVAPSEPEHVEAARFWLDRMTARSGDDHDAPLTARLITELRSRINPPASR
ncbi:phosphotransferase [Promicromonospora iranensis]|uniref:Aminoglycoside phosphotransferase domain-containing protein n=1 Tax=Promicromonospora iranensis TaxID=1105144 RepID=A0ABU2CM80_9MICO|nr:phosphotransferase [Promicromonospora iranensis]MDR7382459.1 hypothetical protein [Promicromonospora iranensis]